MKWFNVKVALLVGVFLRSCVAAWNGFWGPSFGAEYDALGFHQAAVQYSNNLVLDHFVVGHIYSYILGIFYFITTDSLFLGSMLSVVIWCFSALILLQIMRSLVMEYADQCKVMFIYALLPSSLMLTSITLREPYQLLFINLAAFAVLQIHLQKSKRYWLMLILAVAGMGILHGALLAAGLFVFLPAAFILWSFNSENGFSLARLFLVGVGLIISGYYGYALLSTVYINLVNGLDAAVQGYQKGIASYPISRATYRTGLEINSLLDLIISTPRIIFHYLFEPLPWRITALIDVVALLENSLRIWLIWRFFKYCRDDAGEKRRLIIFVFLAYIAMETIWSMGVSNWGTALRHHLPSIGLLLVAAFAYKGKQIIWINNLMHKYGLNK